MLRPLLAAAALLLALPAAPMAQDRTGADDALRWSVSRDPAVARAAPDFAAFLKAEAEDALFIARDEAAIARAAAQKAGAPFRPHGFALIEDMRAAAPGFVSVLRATRRATGGTESAVWLDSMVWDVARKDIVTLGRFFPPTREGVRGLEVLVKALKADLQARPGLWPKRIAMATVVDPAALQFFTLERSTQGGRIGGIGFHFAPAELGPKALGSQHVIIPQSLFRHGVDPELRPLFAGSPLR